MDKSDDYIPVFQYRGALSEADVDRMMAEEEEEESYSESFVKETKSAKRKGRPASAKTKKKKKSHKHRDLDEAENEDIAPLRYSNDDNQIDNNNNNNNNSQTIVNSIEYNNIDDDDENENNNNNYNNNNNNNYNNAISLDDDDNDCIAIIPQTRSSTRSNSSTSSSLSSSSSYVNSSISSSIDISNSPEIQSFNKNNSYSSSNSSSSNNSFPTINDTNDEITLFLKMVGEQPYSLKIRQKEPIKILVDKYSKQFNLVAADLQLKQYGLPMEHSKSPNELYLIDQDTLDVTIKEIAKPMVMSVDLNDAPPIATQAIDDPNKLVLILRCEGNSHKFKLGKDDTFEKLLTGISKKIITPPNKQILLKFDGMNLNLKSTPNNEDMDDEDLIDVVFK
ncbi:ubiquitin-like protein [Heterostelium album PN500]|uniref:Ubiquitin-like protein n=1 Tax=Heterostelium pallidum (strain ATCC 26659 / Pp 5 / PN500) TaxID=670386 RepID=D3BJQ6_HETP5|nr:ubiquitin-like protein [Heterostelium album PN500]EFA78136.1 ubiquitin-like protein [Heterostelium album PN500]|eukprot:XP_020430262.1 ubiquitin-like protein [Heterostelium album PN500]